MVSRQKKKKTPEDKIEFLLVGTDADMLFPSYACNTRTDVVVAKKSIIELGKFSLT